MFFLFLLNVDKAWILHWDSFGIRNRLLIVFALRVLIDLVNKGGFGSLLVRFEHHSQYSQLAVEIKFDIILILKLKLSLGFKIVSHYYLIWNIFTFDILKARKPLRKANSDVLIKKWLRMVFVKMVLVESRHELSEGNLIFPIVDIMEASVARKLYLIFKVTAVVR